MPQIMVMWCVYTHCTLLAAQVVTAHVPASRCARVLGWVRCCLRQQHCCIPVFRPRRCALHPRRPLCSSATTRPAPSCCLRQRTTARGRRRLPVLALLLAAVLAPVPDRVPAAAAAAAPACCFTRLRTSADPGPPPPALLCRAPEPLAGWSPPPRGRLRLRPALASSCCSAPRARPRIGRLRIARAPARPGPAVAPILASASRMHARPTPPASTTPSASSPWRLAAWVPLRLTRARSRSLRLARTRSRPRRPRLHPRRLARVRGSARRASRPASTKSARPTPRPPPAPSSAPYRVARLHQLHPGRIRRRWPAPGHLRCRPPRPRLLLCRLRRLACTGCSAAPRLRAGYRRIPSARWARQPALRVTGSLLAGRLPAPIPSTTAPSCGRLLVEREVGVGCSFGAGEEKSRSGCPRGDREREESGRLLAKETKRVGSRLPTADWQKKI